jgi:drug/metabolite transporter (DMT)-like permease
MTFSGPLFALSTAILWAIAPMFMASAGRRIGSLPVTLLRMVMAVVLLLGTLSIESLLFKIDWPGRAQVAWLVASGAAGMMIGDLLIYESYVSLGTRRTIQALTFAPVVSSLLAWVFLHEPITPRMGLGMILVVAGTCYAVLNRPDGKSREHGRITTRGLLFAIGGATFMGIGAVLTRQSFKAGPPFDALVATAIRVCSGFMFLWTIPLLSGRVLKTLSHLKNPFIFRRIAMGTLMGPFLGMLGYVSALKYSPTGLVSTLVATSPLFAIPLTAMQFRTKISPATILAAAIAVTGVGLICL